MYKVNTQDLEKIQKTLKLVEQAIKKTDISNSVRNAVSNTIILIDDNYLNIKPMYI